MGLIAGFINVITKKSLLEKNEASNYIFYKIVNFNFKANKYLLQCINTKATFLLSISQIIIDTDILHGLHPIQACFIGIEYAIGVQQKVNTLIFTEQPKKKDCLYRYGSYRLDYQDRHRNICFVDIRTDKSFIMDPRDIALSENIIGEFDAIDAFYVGFMAGLKIAKPYCINESKTKNIRPQLTLIK